MKIVGVHFNSPAVHPDVEGTALISVLTVGTIGDFAAYKALVPRRPVYPQDVIDWVAANGTKMGESEAREVFLFPAKTYRR